MSVLMSILTTMLTCVWLVKWGIGGNVTVTTIIVQEAKLCYFELSLQHSIASEQTIAFSYLFYGNSEKCRKFVTNIFV